MRCVAVIVACMHATALAAVAQDVAEGAPVAVAPQAEWQALLKDVSQSKDANEFDTRMIPFRRRAERDWSACFEQLLAFHADSAARGNVPVEKADALVGRIVHSLNPPKSAAVAAVVPFLDAADAESRRLANELLRTFEDESVTRPADFSMYRDLIEADIRAKRPTRAALIRRMYDTDASLALRTLLRAVPLRDPAAIRAILAADRAVAELHWKRRYGVEVTPADEQAARDAVEAMSLHDRWWVRLCAAHLMKSDPSLANDAARSRLAADSHPLVSEAAAP